MPRTVPKNASIAVIVPTTCSAHGKYFGPQMELNAKYKVPNAGNTI